MKIITLRKSEYIIVLKEDIFLQHYDILTFTQNRWHKVLGILELQDRRKMLMLNNDVQI